MRLESSVTSLSWIPQGATEGFTRLSFGLGVAHYDPPPPEVLGDLDEFQATDRFRFANRLEAWIEVQDGRVVDAGQRRRRPHQRHQSGLRAGQHRVRPDRPARHRPDPGIGPSWARFVQTAGGQTGFPTPRRVRHEPYLQIGGPVTWSTLALTIHADGTLRAAAGRGQLLSPALGLRPRRSAGRQERVHRPRHLVAGGLRHPHALGGRGLGPDRDRGGVGAGASTLGCCDRCQATVPAASGRPDPGPAGRTG